MYLSILDAGGYPAEWPSQVTFSIDSAENVDRDYRASASAASPEPPAATAAPGFPALPE